MYVSWKRHFPVSALHHSKLPCSFSTGWLTWSTENGFKSKQFCYFSPLCLGLHLAIIYYDEHCSGKWKMWKMERARQLGYGKWVWPLRAVTGEKKNLLTFPSATGFGQLGLSCIATKVPVVESHVARSIGAPEETSPSSAPRTPLPLGPSTPEPSAPAWAPVPQHPGRASRASLGLVPGMRITRGAGLRSDM